MQGRLIIINMAAFSYFSHAIRKLWIQWQWISLSWIWHRVKGYIYIFLHEHHHLSHRVVLYRTLNHAFYNISRLVVKGRAGLASSLAWFLFACDGVRIAYAIVDTILPIFLSCFFAGSAGSSPTSSQNATLPSSSAWPLSASGYSSSFSSISGMTNGLSPKRPLG